MQFNNDLEELLFKSSNFYLYDGRKSRSTELKNMTSFDDVLEEIGQFGLFQRQLFFIMCFISAVFSPIYVGIVFLGFIPDFRCANPAAKELSRKCGWSIEEEMNYTAFLPEDSVDTLYFSQCLQYDTNWNLTSLTCTNPLRNLTSYSSNNMTVTGCTNGWVYDTTGSSIVTEVRGLSVTVIIVILMKNLYKHN